MKNCQLLAHELSHYFLSSTGILNSRTSCPGLDSGNPHPLPQTMPAHLKLNMRQNLHHNDHNAKFVASYTQFDGSEIKKILYFIIIDKPNWLWTGPRTLSEWCFYFPVRMWDVRPFAPLERCLKVFTGAQHNFEKVNTKFLRCRGNSYAFLQCGHLEFKSVVTGHKKKDQFKGNFIARLHVHQTSRLRQETQLCSLDTYW